jgi:hypothetical protein
LKSMFFKPYKNGGRGGIRTHGRVAPTLDFESSSLNQTQTPFLDCYYSKSSL